MYTHSHSATQLSLPETLLLHITFGLQGFQDAVRLDRSLKVIQEDPEIRGNAVKSLILNTLSVVSVGAFDLFILPLLDPHNDKFFHKHFGAVYQAFWLAPLVGLSLWLNVSMSLGLPV
ncbi:hypothetical protein FRB93_001759 [Tulasnella sp. JGI-2019a]|nr:hypothetical protein FRB93_001759 [Tulasnella sp. JGI-2019a]